MNTGVQFTIKVIDRASIVLNKIGDTINRLKGFMSQFGGIFSTAIALKGLYDFKNKLEDIGKTAVNLASNFEQSKIAFTGMLGSADAAKSLLDTLQQFANKTPFEFPQLVSATRLLIAYGFSVGDLIPTLTAVGDAVSGLGGGAETLDRVMRAMGQVKAKGFLSGEEARQMAEAGINSYKMVAEALGVSIPQAMKMSEQRIINADMALAAIVGGMEKRFPGMMAMQSRTLQGVVSTLADTYHYGLRKIGEVALPGLTQLAVMATILVDKLFSDENILKAQNLFSGLFSDQNVYKASGFVGNLIAEFEYLGTFMSRIWQNMKTDIANISYIAMTGIVDVYNIVVKISNIISGAGGITNALRMAVWEISYLVKPIWMLISYTMGSLGLWMGKDPSKIYKESMQSYTALQDNIYNKILDEKGKGKKLDLISDTTKYMLANSAFNAISQPEKLIGDLVTPMNERATFIQSQLYNAWTQAGTFLANGIKPQLNPLEQIANNTGYMAGAMKSTLSAIFGNGGDRMQALATRARFGNLANRGGGLSVNVVVASQKDVDNLRYALNYAAGMAK